MLLVPRSRPSRSNVVSVQLHRANTGLRVSASNGVDERERGLYCLRLWEWLAVPPGANNKLSLPLAGDMHHVAARAPARVAFLAVADANSNLRGARGQLELPAVTWPAMPVRKRRSR